MFNMISSVIILNEITITVSHSQEYRWIKNVKFKISNKKLTIVKTQTGNFLITMMCQDTGNNITYTKSSCDEAKNCLKYYNLNNKVINLILEEPLDPLLQNAVKI